MLPETRYGTVTDAWMTCNPKFPYGHSGIVGAIKEHGFTPGLWVCPNITNMATAEDGGYCLKTDHGALFGDWIRGVIDCTPDTLENQILPCFRKIRESGYGYIKIDGMRHLTYDGMGEAVRLGLMTGEDAFARIKKYMETVRKGLGENVYLLSCWGVITPAIGMTDGMRVSTDAHPTWTAVSMQLFDSARWFFAQRILFTLDPDHICVRAKYEWARMLLSLVSLSGGLYMISDPPESYDEARLDLIRKTLPPLDTVTAETGPVDLDTPTCARGFRDYDDEQLAYDITYIDRDEPNPFSSLWAYHMQSGDRSWCVVQRNGIVPLKKTSITVDKLSLDPEKTYYAFDFWRQKPLGTINGTLDLPEIGLGDTCVIALHDITDGKIRLLGSDRHVSCDDVSVVSAGHREGSFTMELNGFPGLTVNYTVYTAGQRLRVAACPGAEVSWETSGDTGLLTVRFAENSAKIRLDTEVVR